MNYLVTTNPGLEEITIKEINEKLNLNAKHGQLPGHVIINTKKTPNLNKLRTIHHIYKLITITNAKSLEDIEKIIKNIDFYEYLKDKKSFRITSKRTGNHNFTSMDIQKIAGKIIKETYNLNVNLTNFDIEIEVDLFKDKVFIGIKLTKEPLSKRTYKIKHHPASLNPVIAYSLASLLKPRINFLDPMCGAGIIPIERYSYIKEQNSNEEIFASDKIKKYIEISQFNALKANANIKFFNYNIETLSKKEMHFDNIIVDPPYGIRLTQEKIGKLYHKLFYFFQKKLNKEAILITIQKELSLELIEKYNLKLEKHFVIEHGGIYPHVFKISKY